MRSVKRRCSTARFFRSYNSVMSSLGRIFLILRVARGRRILRETVALRLTPKLDFEDTTNGMRLIYHVPSVDGISAAWLEVWDRPKRLFRTPVPVKIDGQIIWDPDDPYPTTPEMLSLAIYDAELPEFCIDTWRGARTQTSKGHSAMLRG